MKNILTSRKGLAMPRSAGVVFASLAMMAAGAACADHPVRQASVAGEQLSVTVRYGDLDLGGDEGARVLYSRLRAAANQVCDPLDSRDLYLQAARRACYRNALDNAVLRLGNARVAALHSGDDRGPVPVAQQARYEPR